jgi:two-component system, NtrC family, sensor kinase
VLDEFFWRQDGYSFPVEYSSRQIRRKGKLVGAVVNFLDITERKRQELELRHGQKLEAVGRLAAGIAHEINTPVQFVGANTRFLRTSFADQLKLLRKYVQLQDAAANGLVDPAFLAEVSATRQQIEWPYLEEEIPRARDQMLEGLGRISTIVRGMKEFSHVDRSNQMAPGDLNRALESTLIVARIEIKYVAEVEAHFAPLPPVVCHLGDLNQVFLNLLINAAHAIEDVMKKTGCEGKISVNTRADGDWVENSVADSGTGIPEEAAKKYSILPSPPRPSAREPGKAWPWHRKPLSGMLRLPNLISRCWSRPARRNTSPTGEKSPRPLTLLSRYRFLR